MGCNIKMRFIRLLCIFSVFITVFVFSSCSNTQEETTSQDYVYTPSGSGEPTTFSEYRENISIDTSWQKNYEVEYTYFNSEQFDGELNIKEIKNSSRFLVEYLDNSAKLYYAAAGNDTDYYVIMPDENKQVYSKLEDTDFSNLSSMFMKLTAVSASLPSQNNVLYMYDEAVAGRNCHKYIQRAYVSGEVTQSVYVWIDAQYGFAVKCEAYDSDDKLTTYWEVKSFLTGEVGENETFVNLADYEFEEN